MIMNLKYLDSTLCKLNTKRMLKGWNQKGKKEKNRKKKVKRMMNMIPKRIQKMRKNSMEFIFPKTFGL